jgi:hypothetical protein
MDGKLTTVRCLIGDVLLLRIIGHKPLKVSERNTLAVRQNIAQLFKMLGLVEKSRQAFEQQFGLGHCPRCVSFF